jgi:phosphoribosylaminoimidazole (AIR) synthetase
VLPIFEWLQRGGGVPQEDMLRTFNMGVGLILVVAPADADRVIAALAAAGERDAGVIGEIVPSASSDPRVRYAGGI